MLVSKWGNSLAVRLPATVVSLLELREGDDVEITIEDRRVFSMRKNPDVAERLRLLRGFRGRLPADFKFNRNEANGNDANDRG